MTLNRPPLLFTGGVTRPSLAGLVAATAIAAGLGSGPAAAESGPEQPPLVAPIRLAPEPAPVAVPAAAPATSTQGTQRSTPHAVATTARPAAVVTSTRPVESRTPRPARVARPKPKPALPPAGHRAAVSKVKSLAHAIQMPEIRFAVATAPPKPTDSNGLLFVGGLLLLVLVIGDAAFLALSARVLNDPADR